MPGTGELLGVDYGLVLKHALMLNHGAAVLEAMLPQVPERYPANRGYHDSRGPPVFLQRDLGREQLGHSC